MSPNTVFDVSGQYTQLERGFNYCFGQSGGASASFSG